MVYNIEVYGYLPKIWIHFFLHFDFRSDPEPDPEYFFSWSGSVEKMSDPHPWKKYTHVKVQITFCLYGMNLFACVQFVQFIADWQFSQCWHEKIAQTKEFSTLRYFQQMSIILWCPPKYINTNSMGGLLTPCDAKFRKKCPCSHNNNTALIKENIHVLSLVMKIPKVSISFFLFF